MDWLIHWQRSKSISLYKKKKKIKREKEIVKKSIKIILSKFLSLKV